MRGWTMALGLAAAAALAGVIAHGAATASTPYVPATVEVTVWRDLADGELYVGAREEGGLWRREPAALAFSVTSASGRFQRSGIVELAIPLRGLRETSLKAAVWRSVADPSRLYLSVHREGWGWRTGSAPLAMRAYGERYERADAVDVEVALSVPRSAPVTTSVAGPLAVFTVPVGRTWSDDAGWWESREVFMLDTATDRYWRTFTYQDESPSWVRMAGTSLVVANARQVRRIGLDGRDEAVLFEGADIGGIVISPDGAKVAVLQDAGILTVLDADTGRTLLRRARLAAALLPDASSPAFALAGWNVTSDRIAVAAAGDERTRTGILTLAGALRLLPPNAGNLSPDFRYAIQPHDGMNGNLLRAVPQDYWSDWPWQWGWVWSGFDVIETASGHPIHTATATADTFFLPSARTFGLDWQWPAWWPDGSRYSWFEINRSNPGLCGYDLRERTEEGSVTAMLDCAEPYGIAFNDMGRWESGGRTSAIGPRTLDVASGETREPDRAEWRRSWTDATRLFTQGSCWSGAGQGCSLFHEGVPVWNGPAEAIGVIDLGEPLTLHGVGRLEPPRLPGPLAPPAREEMVGPLFAWSIASGYETVVDPHGIERFHPLRRIVVYDEGTGRSWGVHDYRLGERVWPARGGFGLQTNAVRHVAPDGQARTLIDSDSARVTVSISPGGGRVAILLGSNDSRDFTLAIFALPSGEELLRIERDDPRFGAFLANLTDIDEWDWEWWSRRPEALRLGDWSLDGTALLLKRNDEPWSLGVLNLDGSFAALPDGVWENDLSPEFRYAVRVGATAYADDWALSNISIIEVASGRVVRTASIRQPAANAVSPRWQWTADGRFAWSPSNSFDFRASMPDGDPDAEVWLLDVETGAVERLSAREYAARLPQPTPAPELPSASVSCPGAADIIQLCAVLLDGEVVGEGRWAEAIGFVALD